MPTLHFKGKTFVQNHHLAVKYHQLVPKKELSLTDKVSLHDNLIIQGDNLKALKALLPTYAGKIKCIYIDVPYNTGNENWVYNDNVNSPMIQEWLGKAVDIEDLTRHDKWLCMMMPRLKLLRELLSEDGAIFISCDDNELANLRVLLNEIFGENNFYSQVIVRANSRGQTYNQIAKTHEYLIVYTKNPETELFELEKDSESNDLNLNDEIGAFNIRELRNRNPKFGKHNRPNLFYPIYINPKSEDKDGFCLVSLTQSKEFSEMVEPFNSQMKESCWRWGKDKVTKNVSSKTTTSNLVAKKKNDGSFGIYEKYRKTTFKPKSIWDDNSFLNETGTIELRELGLENQFDFPKPKSLVKQCIALATTEGDIVLDSFAGSGTTAQAVLELNEESGVERNFILVEMESYANELTAERTRRVIKGVKTAKSDLLKKGTGGSFSYFELGDTIEMESLLRGKNLPSYTEFARYLFYTATGEEFNEKAINEKTGFIGESKNYEVYLFYKADIDWLKKNALTLELCKSLPKFKNKQRLVFAPAKYVDDHTLLDYRIDFCQLPYEIYRLNR
ncbi:MAG TPA: site-specific DNA-methyltransferase [Ferruginibacter sp.]|nr:site-specific DNA-methyltransferase [Ferruginibacter sp.]HRO17041.1 site-specific DNA-methyltransferase [Ferruginibacter sp.]HRQ19993.1 site-specific DNA-methyltransferase [Ferruginibacter sp.]